MFFVFIVRGGAVKKVRGVSALLHPHLNSARSFYGARELPETNASDASGLLTTSAIPMQRLFPRDPMKGAPSRRQRKVDLIDNFQEPSVNVAQRCLRVDLLRM